MNVMTAFTAESTYGTFGRRERIRIRRGLIGCGAGFTVALDEDGGIRYTGENRWGQKDAGLWEDMLSVYCGPDYVLGLCRDGAVLSVGRSNDHGINVKSWAGVMVMACGPRHAAALISNGQVLASGNDANGQCRTEHWTDMVDVCCGRNFTVGLKKDGTLLIAGGNKALHHALEHWSHISGIFTDVEGRQVYAITYGDGKLLSSGRLPAYAHKWKNLVYVAASARGLVGIDAHGRIFSSRREDEKKLSAGERDYTACAMSPGHMAALCRNGEVIALGHNEFGQCTTARWGTMFHSFEDHSARRRENEQEKTAAERIYQQRLTEARRHGRRIVCGERLTACIQADGRVNTTAGLRNVKNWQNVYALSCGTAHIVALHKDGTVSASGNNVNGCCHVSDWKHITDIRTGKYHSLGLCEDGRVVFAGWNVHGQGQVSEWKDICLLRSTDTYTVGVDRHGKIFTSGKQLPFDPNALDTAQWSELVDLQLSEHHMVGLRKDGRVVGVGDATCGRRDEMGRLTELASWRGIRALAVGDGFTLGLCYGGRVLAAGRNHFGQCEVEQWKNVVSIGCGRTFSAALTVDGRVITAGQHLSGEGQDLSPDEIGGAVMAWEKAVSTGYEPFHTQWMSDILTLKCGPEHLVTVDRFGQIAAEGLDLDNQCTSASTFVLFRNLQQLDGFGVFTTAADLIPINTIPERETPTSDDLNPDSGHLSAKELSSGQLNGGRVMGHLHKDRYPAQALRSAAEMTTRRITCGDHYMTVCTMDGRAFSYHLGLETVCALPPAPTGALPVSVASAKDVTTVLCGDGSAYVLPGYATAPEPLPIPERTDTAGIQEVAVGKEHTAVLMKDGTVRAFGENLDGRCDTNHWHNVVSVAVGKRHTVGLTADGRVLATGSHNRDEAKVTPHFTLRNDPCHTGLWQEIAQVVCSTDLTYGITRSGDVKAVGRNVYGQCRTEGWHHVVSLATSGSHTVALFRDGHVDAIGRNDSGECDVKAWENIILVAASGSLTLGLTADGRVLSAGKRSGELDLGGPVYGMAVFGNRQLFVMLDGTLRICTGEQEKAIVLPRELALFRTSPEEGILLRVSTLLPWDMTARALLGRVGQTLHSCFYIREDGVGMSTVKTDTLPSELTRQGACAWVSAGAYHALMITKDGRLISCGKCPEGQEVNTLIKTASEMGLANDTAWTSVTCGSHHTAAVTAEGRVVAVGASDHGQCSTAHWERVSMVACGASHTVGMTEDGHALAAGDHAYGQCDVDGWQGLAMVACGERHTVGLTLDGHVVAVGDDRMGQCRVSTAEHIISVACLPEATVCVGADGHVSIYGGTGEFRDRVAALEGIVAVYAKEYRLTALTADGRIIAV